MYRRDRCASGDTRNGGGVVIAVRKSLCPTDVSIVLNGSTEQTWVKLCLPNKNIFIGAVYIPPLSHSSSYDQFIVDVKGIVDSMYPQDDIFICGDFNLPDIQWVPDVDNELILRPTAIDCSFADEMSSLGLVQVCDIKVNNQLDLIYTNVDSNFSVSTAPHALKPDSAHHKSIYLEYTIPCQSDDYDDEEFYDFRKMDKQAMTNSLRNINWDEAMCSNEINEQVSKFNDIVMSSINQHVPKRRRKRKYACKWMTPQLANIRNKKNRAFRRYRRSGNSHDLQFFLNLRHKFLHLNSVLHAEHEITQAELLIENPKQFWKIVNQRRGTSGIPRIMSYGSERSDNSLRSANLFASFFKSVFTNDTVPIPEGPSGNELCDVTLTADELVTELRRLNINKGAGPDNIPNLFLKSMADELANPLLKIFNQSLSSGVFPSAWKTAYVTPIFKSGLRSEVTNYRGVVILSAIPKLFEKLVCVKLEAVLSPLINSAQHGFQNGRSTSTNLVVFVSRLLEDMNGGGQVDAIYTDFAKAFDRVNHTLLIRKLELAGISGTIKMWLESYLTGRTQCVRVSSSVSDQFPVTSGVPQGSHIGPLLFSIFINDLCEQLDNCEALLYADDVKIFRKINSDDDHRKLQNDLDKIAVWCVNNGMALNINKCEVISFKRGSSVRVFNYSTGGAVLKRVDVVKDLGVLIDSKVTFKPQVDQVVARAKSTWFFVKQMSKEFQCPHATKALFVSLVRPLTEYCVVVWSPQAQMDIARVESIQKQFLLFALRSLPWSHQYVLPPYYSRLSLLQLDTLEERRKLAEASFVHSCINGRINVPFFEQRFRFSVPVRVTRAATHQRLQLPEVVVAEYVDKSPVRRCIYTFNEMADCYTQGMSWWCFKSNVKNKFAERRRN